MWDWLIRRFIYKACCFSNFKFERLNRIFVDIIAIEAYQSGVSIDIVARRLCCIVGKLPCSGHLGFWWLLVLVLFAIFLIGITCFISSWFLRIETRGPLSWCSFFTEFIEVYIEFKPEIPIFLDKVSNIWKRVSQRI